MNRRLVLAIGAVFLVLGAIFPLLGLSYVLYWGTMPQPFSAQGFPLYAFWLGVIFLAVGLVGFAISGYCATLSPSRPHALTGPDPQLSSMPVKNESRSDIS